VLGAAALAGVATGARRSGLGGTGARAADGWYAITSDDGKPVANLRLPVELFSQVDELPGLIRVGPDTPDVTIVEFYDYNCPFCRRAAADLADLAAADPDLRLALVNNPVLSPQSQDAAEVELAVLRLQGPRIAYEFHKRLFQLRGRIDADKALAVAGELGITAELARETAASAAVADALDRQLRLAASMGFSATPAFLIAGAGVLGYPGAKSMARIIAAVRRCDAIAC
jgi:protein-disulfide isomerase